MRAIIRFSIDGETRSHLRNAIAGVLEAAGFARGGTASWEHPDIPVTDLHKVMEEFWRLGANPQGQAGADPGVSLDHVWIYADHPPL